MNVTLKDATYCRLVWGKKIVFKTSVSKKTRQPEWNDIFLFPVDRTEDLVLEVYQKKKIGRDVLIGMALVLGRDRWKAEIPVQERLYEENLEILAQLGKPKDVRGRVRVRFLYSCSPETRPRQDIGQNVFFYDDYISQFKTGDLIVYSGVGMLDTFSKLASATDYSRVGLLVKLPNKWTRRDDLYVLEVCRNIDNFVDAFVEKPKHGVCIFRLFERLHHVHATKVWWAPLAQPAKNTQTLITWMWSTHAQDQSFLSTVLLPKSWSEVLDTFNLTKSLANKAELIDLLSGKLIVLALEQCGIRISLPLDRPILAGEIVRSECFSEPVMLRDVDLATPAAELDLPDQYFYVDGKPPSGYAAGGGPAGELSLPNFGDQELEDGEEASVGAAGVSQMMTQGQTSTQPMFFAPDGTPIMMPPSTQASQPQPQYIMTPNGPVPFMAQMPQFVQAPDGSFVPVAMDGGQSSFYQPSMMGQPMTMGQPIVMGQPMTMGQPLVLGQPMTVGQMGQPMIVGSDMGMIGAPVMPVQYPGAAAPKPLPVVPQQQQSLPSLPQQPQPVLMAQPMQMMTLAPDSMEMSSPPTSGGAPEPQRPIGAVSMAGLAGVMRSNVPQQQ
jgi:hypothetical protein